MKDKPIVYKIPGILVKEFSRTGKDVSKNISMPYIVFQCFLS